MATAIVLVAIILGSIIFTWWSPYWFTEIASNWVSMDQTLILTFWITGIVTVIVVLFMAWCIYKYRSDNNVVAEYEPENKKLEVWLTVATTIGVVAMLAPGLIVWEDYVHPPENAVNVEALGKQWEWHYRLPGADGKLGKTDIRFYDAVENPFAIDPEDANGADDVLIEYEELYLPMDQPVKMNLRSYDVLHNFYVPEFRAKMDLVPGMITYFWLTPIRTGRFEVLCAEHCGTGHYTMHSWVNVATQEDYDAWLSEQITYAEYAANVQESKKALAVAEAVKEQALPTSDD